MQHIKDPELINELSAVNAAFSKQALHFDEDDLANPILQAWRKQIYRHVEGFLKPGDRILELNAGTGIDAFYFARKGYCVHATDLSTGMVNQIKNKIAEEPLPSFSYQQVSFEHLDRVDQPHFDYVFSNFGGLNCTQDLSRVTRHLENLLNPGAYLTWVVMPPFCPWELLWLFKGKWKEATRRFYAGGTLAQLEGDYFQSYYHSLSDIQKALGNSFNFIKSEGLGIFSAPPSAIGFYKKYRNLNRSLQKAEEYFNNSFPFNRWGDHIITTFQKTK